MLRRFTSLYLFLLISCSSFAQSKEYIGRINEALNILKQDTALQHAGWGFSLISLKGGGTIMEWGSQTSLQPASTMKVLTTGAALSILGSNYTFKTRLEYQGTIRKDGMLEGNIFIRGGGDPTFGFNNRPGNKTSEIDILKAWTKAMRDAGIQRITGRVIADATHFEKAMQPASWAWDDIGNYYGAGTCGLNFYENQYKLTLITGKKPGSPTRFAGIYPSIIGMKFHNEILTGSPGSGDNGYIFGAPYSYERYLRGTVPMPYPQANVKTDSVFVIKGSMPDPALYCAQSLQLRTPLTGNNLPATTLYLAEEQGEKIDTSGRKVIWEESSPPLSVIVKNTNLSSINLYAETLLKELGLKVYGKGTTEDGIRAVKDFYAKKGMDLNGLFMLDGSGLSRYNAITPGQFTRALYIIHKESCFEDFYASLPVAGRSGSLYDIGHGTAAEGNIHAKSGYMTRVRSYAGYIRSKSTKEEYAFSFIINNYSDSAHSVKEKIEKLLEALAE